MPRYKIGDKVTFSMFIDRYTGSVEKVRDNYGASKDLLDLYGPFSYWVHWRDGSSGWCTEDMIKYDDPFRELLYEATRC